MLWALSNTVSVHTAAAALCFLPRCACCDHDFFVFPSTSFFLLCGGVVLVLLLTLPPPGLCPCVTVTNSHCRELQEQIRVMDQNLKCLSVAEEKVLTFPFLNH